MMCGKIFAWMIGMLVLTGAADAQAGYPMYDHDIGCAAAATGRARTICDAMAAAMEWTWTGHASVDPGDKPTFAGARQVYCDLKIGKEDLEILQTLKKTALVGKAVDWRLESAADMLLRLLNNADGKGDEPENSIFNPKNAAYILKDGCG
jgi:hypothetical protein